MHELKSNYPTPERKTLLGHYCSLHPVDTKKQGELLFHSFKLDETDAGWTYLPYGPFHTHTEFDRWLDALNAEKNLLLFTIHDNHNSQPVGLIGYLNIQSANGTVEIGHVHFSVKLQKTPAATEAIYLLLSYALDELGYRRVEWKCDNANEGSKRCATRIGFSYEGLFRQHWIYKNRSRDTAWFSIIDKEWQPIKAKLNRWLAPENFDDNGNQLKKLSEC